MRNFVLHVDSAAVVAQTNRLEKINAKAMPDAVRGALNNAVYDVKQRTMPQTASRFEKRKPNFFKSQSRVEPARGRDLATMRAMVGFVAPGNDPGHAVKDLEEQEHGGAIDNRAFIPLKGARVSKSWGRSVKNDMRMAAIRSKIVDSEDNTSGRNGKEKFIRSAIHAGKGGFVIGNNVNSKGNRVVLRINSVHKLRKPLKTKGGKKYNKGATVVNSTAVYVVKGGRKVRVRGTHFMEKASVQSGNRLPEYFGKQFRRQMERLR